MTMYRTMPDHEAELRDALFGFFEANESTYRRLTEPDPSGIESLIDGIVWTSYGVMRAWNRGDSNR